MAAVPTMLAEDPLGDPLSRVDRGGPPGTRTPNLRIKSPLLCQIELEARRSVATDARERAVRHVCCVVDMGIPLATER